MSVAGGRRSSSGSRISGWDVDDLAKLVNIGCSLYNNGINAGVGSTVGGSAGGCGIVAGSDGNINVLNLSDDGRVVVDSDDGLSDSFGIGISHRGEERRNSKIGELHCSSCGSCSCSYKLRERKKEK